MLPRNYDINRNSYSSAMGNCIDETDNYYNGDAHANITGNNFNGCGNLGANSCYNPWKTECECSDEGAYIPNSQCGCEGVNTYIDGSECENMKSLLVYNEIQSTELVTIKSSKPKVAAIKNVSCQACVDEVKLITTSLPDGTIKDKCIINGSLIFTIFYFTENRGYSKSEVRFLIPLSNYIILPEGSNFDGNVKLEVEDTYAKSIDGRNLILSAVVLSSVYAV